MITKLSLRVNEASLRQMGIPTQSYGLTLAYVICGVLALMPKGRDAFLVGFPSWLAEIFSPEDLIHPRLDNGRLIEFLDEAVFAERLSLYVCGNLQNKEWSLNPVIVIHAEFTSRRKKTSQRMVVVITPDGKRGQSCN